MRTSESVIKIAPALLKAQRKMGAATKGSANPYFKSKYADLGAVMEVAKDPLNDEGIMILQPSYTKEGSHFVETILMHESGEFISSDPLKLEIEEVNMQKLGSGITYARRYTLQALLSIPAEDDDGEGSMNRKPYSKAKDKTTIDVTVRDNKVTSVEIPAVASTVPVVEPPKSFTTFRNQKKKETLNF